MAHAAFQWDDPFLLSQQLTDDERAIRDAAAAYCQDKLAPRVLDAFRHEKMDVSIFREMGEVGLLGPTIPEQYGGPGLSYVAYGLIAREVERLETGLLVLATVGSAGPFVGLFGTVWGIMHAFTGFAGMEQVTLATVAPGIAEALVATAIGLFSAIPAVIAYNRFARDIDRVATHLETFIEEFSNILQRNLGAQPSQSASGH